MKKYKVIKDIICFMSIDTGNGSNLCAIVHINAGQEVIHVENDKQFPLVTKVIIDDPNVTYQILNKYLEEIK